MQLKFDPLSDLFNTEFITIIEIGFIFTVGTGTTWKQGINLLSAFDKYRMLCYLLLKTIIVADTEHYFSVCLTFFKIILLATNTIELEHLLKYF